MNMKQHENWLFGNILSIRLGLLRQHIRHTILSKYLINLIKNHNQLLSTFLLRLRNHHDLEHYAP